MSKAPLSFKLACGFTGTLIAAAVIAEFGSFGLAGLLLVGVIAVAGWF